MSFWKNKDVLVTGHTGFKGAWLTWWLLRKGARVHGFALAPSTDPSLFELLSLRKHLASHHESDIRDHGAVQEAVNIASADVVLHMAAQPLVRYSYQQPLETFSVNVMGTANLLEAVRKNGRSATVINVTTDKCYSNQEWCWPYRENDRLGGHDPYSSSKACSELVTASYRDAFLRDQRIRVATARAGNVIGGGDWSTDRLIPDFLKATDRGDELVIRSPAAIRPWQHVLEPLSGYLSLAERLSTSEAGELDAVNFGPDSSDAKSVEWIVKTLCERSNTSFRVDGSENVHEANVLKLDSTLARVRLGWVPRWNVELALGQTLDWHEHWRAGKDVRDITTQQIQAYEGWSAPT